MNKFIYWATCLTLLVSCAGNKKDIKNDDSLGCCDSIVDVNDTLLMQSENEALNDSSQSGVQTNVDSSAMADKTIPKEEEKSSSEEASKQDKKSEANKKDAKDNKDSEKSSANEKKIDKLLDQFMEAARYKKDLDRNGAGMYEYDAVMSSAMNYNNQLKKYKKQMSKSQLEKYNKASKMLYN